MSLREGREPLLPLVGHAVSQGQLLAQHYHNWAKLFRENFGIQPAATGVCLQLCPEYGSRRSSSL